jgi:hypothetical protein
MKVFIHNWLNVMLLYFVLCFFLGVLLGIEYFIKKYIQKGKWKIDRTRLIIIGTPLLFLSVSFLLISPYGFFPNVIFTHTVIFLLIDNKIFIDKILSFSQIILGYIFITSFYKDNNEA